MRLATRFSFSGNGSVPAGMVGLPVMAAARGWASMRSTIRDT
jgi:hypothetical protein